MYVHYYISKLTVIKGMKLLMKNLCDIRLGQRVII